MKDINKTVAAAIRRIRKEQGHSQDTLGKVAGLHRAYIGQCERGEKKIGLTNLQKIAVALDVDICDFFEDWKRPKRRKKP